MRELALFLHKNRVPSEIVVKGIIPEDVLAIVSPYEYITITPTPRWFFAAALAWRIIAAAPAAARTAFVFSRERTQRRFKRLLGVMRTPSILLRETKAGYDLYASGKKIEDRSTLLPQ